MAIKLIKLYIARTVSRYV